ncbi:MAG: SRPBCC family protein [Nocardioidaceae bacterium]
MDLTHRFTVPAPIEEAWAAFNDLERIAPCFPGAALTSYDGDEFAGLVKVKLGPISLQYTGTGRFVERDESAYRAVLEAKGKDKRGNGTAAATITARLVSGAGAATDVEVVTKLNITGKPAQFGRGVMQDVSDKLLGQFATCLETELGSPATEPQPGSEAQSAHSELRSQAQPESVTEPGSVTVTEPAEAADPMVSLAVAPDAEPPPEPAGSEAGLLDGPPSAAATEPPRSAPRPAAALDLGTTVLPILVRRYAPYAVASGVGLVVVWRLVRRLR